MAPRVAFKVDAKASKMMEEQLLTEDVKGDKLQWMSFKLGNEEWLLDSYGKPEADWPKKMLKGVPKSEGRHYLFRSAKKGKDVWVRYIPEDATVKERTCFATAKDSLLDNVKTRPKVELEIRDPAEMSEKNPALKEHFVE